jgi:VanZ family protein
MSVTEPWRNPRPAPNLDEVRNRMSTSSLLKALLRAWWPALVWAAVIFTLSTDAFSARHTGLVIEPILRWLFPSMSAEGLDLAHHVIRKCAHLTEYFIFFLLLYRGVRATRTTSRGWHTSSALIAWFIAAAYSATDEIHQIFVPSRGPSPWDSLLDSTGALIALFVLYLLYHRFLRARSASFPGSDS